METQAFARAALRVADDPAHGVAGGNRSRADELLASFMCGQSDVVKELKGRIVRESFAPGAASPTWPAATHEAHASGCRLVEEAFAKLDEASLQEIASAVAVPFRRGVALDVCTPS